MATTILWPEQFRVCKGLKEKACQQHPRTNKGKGTQECITIDENAPEMDKEHILDRASLRRDGPKAFGFLILYQDHLLHGASSRQSYLSTVFQIHPYSIYDDLKARLSPKHRPRTAEGLLPCFILKGQPPGCRFWHGEGKRGKGPKILYPILRISSTEWGKHPILMLFYISFNLSVSPLLLLAFEVVKVGLPFDNHKLSEQIQFFLYTLHHMVILKVLFSSLSQSLSFPNHLSAKIPYFSLALAKFPTSSSVSKEAVIKTAQNYKRTRLCERLCEDLLFHSQDLLKHNDFRGWTLNPSGGYFQKYSPYDLHFQTPLTEEGQGGAPACEEGTPKCSIVTCQVLNWE